MWIIFSLQFFTKVDHFSVAVVGVVLIEIFITPLETKNRRGALAELKKRAKVSKSK